MAEASKTLAENNRATTEARATTLAQARLRRPRLTAGTIFQSLDWVLDHSSLLGSEVDLHMQAIELAIRTMGNEAQAKDTQHTLVRDGVIEPPPAASPSA
jgi:hypothetical protein